MKRNMKEGLAISKNVQKDNKGQGMKEELIKYVMEKADKYYSDDFPITDIECWIREFFDQYQPDSSKREDPTNSYPEIMAEIRNQQDKMIDKILGCGARNTVETS